jgi:hypothetical protein
MVPRANYRNRHLGTNLMMCSTINDVLDRRRFRNLRRRHVAVPHRKGQFTLAIFAAILSAIFSADVMAT